MTNGRKLGDPVRPADTNNTLAYEVITSTYKATITLINVANNTADLVTFRIMHVPAGGVADESTTLYWDVEVPPNTTYPVEVPYELDGIGDQLIVRSDTADALTFYLYGRLHNAS